MVCRCDWWGHILGSVQNGTRGDSTGNLGGGTRDKFHLLYFRVTTISQQIKLDITLHSRKSERNFIVEQFNNSFCVNNACFFTDGGPIGGGGPALYTFVVGLCSVQQFRQK